MHYTEIRKTGVKIPAIIFGTSALGNLYSEPNEDTKLAIVRESIQNMEGPVAFDTAGKYGAGLALEKLGEKLDKLKADPKKIIISNKLGWLRTKLTGEEPDFEKGVWINIKHNAILSISYDGIIKCWHQGIELLGEFFTPQLVSIHDPDEYLSIHNADSRKSGKHRNDILAGYKALHDLKKDGLVKAIGIGAKDWQIIKNLAEDVDFDWVMFANSLTIYRHPKELLKFMSELQEKSICIINSAVFNAGFLTGGNYFDYKFIDVNNPQHRKLVNWRESFFKICNDFSISPAQACIHFGRSHPGVKAIALNTSNPAHVKRNIEAIQNEVPVDFYTALKKKRLIADNYPYV